MKTMIGVAALLFASAAHAAPAYVIGEITVTDPARFQTYASQTIAALKPFGGVYRVRGGNGAALEGAAPASRVVVIEFPSRAAAEAWYKSDAYKAIRPIRQASTTSRLFLVDGLDPTP